MGGGGHAARQGFRVSHTREPAAGRRIRLSLRQKVLASFVLAYTVLTGSFLYLIVVNLHRLAEDEIVDAARHKAIYLSAAVSGHLAEGDRTFLTAFLEKIVHGGDLEYARAEGPDGSVFAETGIAWRYAGAAHPETRSPGIALPLEIREIGRQEGLLHAGGHAFAISSPVSFGGRPAGRLLIGMNTADVNRRIAAVTYDAIIVAVVILFVGTGLTVLLHRRMQTAMRELTRTTVSIADGDLDRRASVATGDELEDFAEAFNRMAQTVGDRERELVRMRNTMVSMFDGITEGIAYVDRECRILHANRAYSSFRGADGNEAAAGRKCFEILWGEQHGCESCPGRIAMRTGRSARAEKEIPRPNGEPRVLQIHAYPVVLDGEGGAGFVEYVSDVTRQRQLEAELKRHAERLEEIVQERTRRLREAQQHVIHKEKIAALGQMAAGLAHEIGNPLSSLSSVLRSFAVNPGKDGEREERLRFMQDQVERIATIVREMGDFSRPATFGKSLVHVNEVIRTAIGIARYDGRFQGVHVITSLDREIPAVKLDGDRLLQVFMNILLNAADAMGGNGTLSVSSRGESRSVSVLFGDNGPGIREEIISRIFEPFYTTKDVGKGSGLGLSVSYGIMQGMGGAIRAENKTGGGSLFTVEIPLPDATGGTR